MDLSELERLRAEVAAAETAFHESQGVHAGEAWTEKMLYLSGGVLAFGLVVLLLMSYLLVKSDRDPISILRTFCVPLIIVAALVLVITGYTQDQISPVIGLLGTLAGYLLGKSDGHPREASTSHNSTSEHSAVIDSKKDRSRSSF
jgi:hypothetical protein